MGGCYSGRGWWASSEYKSKKKKNKIKKKKILNLSGWVGGIVEGGGGCQVTTYANVPLVLPCFHTSTIMRMRMMVVVIM